MNARLIYGFLVVVLCTSACASHDNTGPETPAGPGPLAQLTIISGADQSGTVMAALPQDLVVRATDSKGSVITGLAVTFNVLSGGGTLTKSATITDAGGEARVTWILGSQTSSIHEVRAEAVDPKTGAGANATFKATAIAGPVAAITRISGNSQTGDPGIPLASPIRVRVTDAWSNPVPNAPVSWASNSGETVTPTSATTDSLGYAQATWILKEGVNHEVVASSGAQQISFSASLTAPGPLASLTLIEGDQQTGDPGVELPVALGVRATDANGRPIKDLSVSFQVTSGGGSFFSPTATTNASGEARDRWTLGTVYSIAQSSVAKVVDPGTGVAKQVTFSASLRAGAPASFTILAGNFQDGLATKTLAIPLVAKVLDSFGNPVAGASVTWSTTGGGTVTPSGATAGIDGSVVGVWTLGTSGSQTATVAIGAVKTTFNATLIPAAAGWTFLKEMPLQVRSASAVYLNGKIHVLGGYIGTNYTDAHQVYDIATDSWSTTAAPLPVKHDNAAAVVASDGIHLLGGSTTSGTETAHWVYDESADRWVAAAPLPEARRAGVAVVVADKIYLFGGLNSFGVVQNVSMFDVATKTWTSQGVMPTPRYWSSATFLNGEIVVAGGSTAIAEASDVVSAFNPANKTWRDLTPLHDAREALGVFVMSDRLCAVGGRHTGELDNTAQATIWCRPTTGTGWQDIGPMARPKSEFASVLVDGKLYMFGGTQAIASSKDADRMGPIQ